MRLDLLLKQSGIIKRRVIAKQFCERGLVFLNGKEAKPSAEVKDGDMLEIKMGNKVVSCNVVFEKKGNHTIIHVNPCDVKEDNQEDA